MKTRILFLLIVQGLLFGCQQTTRADSFSQADTTKQDHFPNSAKISELVVQLDSVQLAKLNELVVSSARASREDRRGPVIKILDFIKDYWVILLLIGSGIGLVLGYHFYHLSPIQPFEEIAAKQKEYRRVQQQQELKHEILKIFNDLGDSLLDVGRLDAAKKEFQKSLKIDPLDTRSQMGLYKSEIFIPIVRNNYDPELMEKRLTLFSKKYPNDMHIYGFLGDFYRDKNNDSALQYYNKAISLNPGNAFAYFGMGCILDFQNEPKKALEYYSKSLNLSVFNEDYRNNIADKYYQMGDYKEAISYYESILALNSYYQLAYYDSSKIYLIQGKFDFAFRRLLQCVQNFDNPTVLEQVKNKSTWIFRTKKMSVYFSDNEKKKYYACLILTFICCLRDDIEYGTTLLRNTRTFYNDSDNSVRQLINHDVNMIERVNKEIARGAKTFFKLIDTEIYEHPLT